MRIEFVAGSGCTVAKVARDLNRYLRENRIRCGIRMHDKNTINHEEMTIIVQARHIIDA